MLKIVSNLEKGIGKTIGYPAKWFSKALEKGYNDPAKYATAMLVTSIVSKDIVGCAFYTTQSLHNKKIPEDKRKFVAALDLMNGILMVGGQILAAKVIEKTLTKYLFNNALAKKLTKDELDRHANTICNIEENVAKKLDPKKVFEILMKNHAQGSKKYKALETGFGLLVGFLATTAITKRLVVPFLSTPLAGWYKNKFMDKDKKEGDKDFKMPIPIYDRMYYQHKSLISNGPQKNVFGAFH